MDEVERCRCRRGPGSGSRLRQVLRLAFPGHGPRAGPVSAGMFKICLHMICTFASCFYLRLNSSNPTKVSVCSEKLYQFQDDSRLQVRLGALDNFGRGGAEESNPSNPMFDMFRTSSTENFKGSSNPFGGGGSGETSRPPPRDDSYSFGSRPSEEESFQGRFGGRGSRPTQDPFLMQKRPIGEYTQD